MAAGREARSVRKMNSERKVRRCGQGGERGAQAWGARLAPLGVGVRDAPFHIGGLGLLGPRVPEDVYHRRFFFSPLEYSLGGVHVVCGRQAASLLRTPPSEVP